MELTRRDALRAMVVGGGAAGGSLLVSETLSGQEEPADGAYTESDVEKLTLVAEVVYPSEVEVTTEFVDAYVGRLDADRKAALSDAVGRLDSVTRSRYGRAFSEASASERESMLRALGVDRVESTPAGTTPERIRYHLVNTLLYALFTSPTGSKLTGIENPLGHPGGFASYDND